MKSKEMQKPDALIVGVGRSERLQRRASESKLKDKFLTPPKKVIAKPKTKGKGSSKMSKNKQLEEEMTKSIRTRQTGQLPPPELDESGRLTQKEVRIRRVTSDRNESTMTFINTSADVFTDDTRDPPQSRPEIMIEYAFASQRGYYPNGTSLRGCCDVMW